ncbi:MAG: YbaB/EbfC family nucleoid-associated protein [Planctomycetaceae bacterium]|jgi:hypothetical protein
MFKQLGQMAAMAKQAGELKERMREMQDRLQQARFEGVAAGGAVRVEVSGLLQVIDCQIAPALVQTGDAPTVSRLVLVATNAALENARKGAAEAMAEVTGGLDLPGLSGLIPGR